MTEFNFSDISDNNFGQKKTSFETKKLAYELKNIAYYKRIADLNEEYERITEEINETTVVHDTDLRGVLGTERDEEFEEKFNLHNIVNTAFREEVNPHWLYQYIVRTHQLCRVDINTQLPDYSGLLSHHDYYYQFVQAARGSGMNRSGDFHAHLSLDKAYNLAQNEEKRGLDNPLEKWSVAYSYTTNNLSPFLKRYYSYGDR